MQFGGSVLSGAHPTISSNVRALPAEVLAVRSDVVLYPHLLNCPVDLGLHHSCERFDVGGHVRNVDQHSRFSAEDRTWIPKPSAP